MSIAEIKAQVASLSPEERLELAAFIVHLGRSDDLQYRADLDLKLSEMDAGKKFGAEDLGRLHRELNASEK